MKSVRILFLIAASVLLVSGCAQEAPTETIATTEQLMLGMVQPVAEVVWESVQTIVDREGVHEMRPETEDDWEFVRNSAISLAESANLVMVQGRPLSEGTPERGDDWNEYSENLITRALEAADAAQARDPDALFTAGSNIYEDACLACHEAYLPEDALPEL